MPEKKKIKCQFCSKEFESTTDTIMDSCPSCGALVKVNKRWDPDGTQKILDE